MLPLTILTLNVRGMASADKRDSVFRFLRTHPAHVVCLQEVHAPPDCDFWTVQWGSAASWNYFTAILLSPSLGSPTFDVSHGGRVLASTFRFQGQVFKIANIYAHAARPARVIFFDELSAKADTFSSFDFLAGDWNAYPDPIRDRRSTAPPPETLSWPNLLPVLAPFADAALAGASSPYHTFHRVPRDSPSVHTRIDHVFVNVRHTSFSPSTKLLTYSPSDHQGVQVTFSTRAYTPRCCGVIIPSFFLPLPFALLPSLVSPLTVLLPSGTPPRSFFVLMPRISPLFPPASVSLSVVSLNVAWLLPTVVPLATSGMLLPMLLSLLSASNWTTVSLWKPLALPCVLVSAG